MSPGLVFRMRSGRVTRGTTVVLDGIDFALERGEFLALLGPNGSGKTTLVSAMLGLLPVDAGTIELFGTPIRRFREWWRIGYVPQRASAVPSVPATALEVVLLGRLARTRLLGGWTRRDRAAAVEALAAVGLSRRAQDPAASLSGGQQQRVRVARALAGEPDVLVLDEPFSWMDAEAERSTVGALEDFRGRGAAVLLVAHDLHEVDHLVDRVVVLGDGTVRTEGPPSVAEELPLDLHHHWPPATGADTT